MARRLGRTALLLGAAALIWAASATLFTVDVTEYGVVSRFGRIVRIVEQPGLHLKSPLDRVLRLERRLLHSRPARAEYLTADKKNVVVRSLATWRIAEPERFLRTLRSRANAEERLADMILGEIGAALGRYPFAALVSSGDGQGRFATMVADVSAAVAAAARPAFGIDIVDVDVRKLYLPDQNKQSVFERMKAERGRMAAQYRSEGERDAQALIAQADAERARLMAAADEQARRLRSEGEAEAIRVFAEAFGQAPEFTSSCARSRRTGRSWTAAPPCSCPPTPRSSGSCSSRSPRRPSASPASLPGRRSRTSLPPAAARSRPRSRPGAAGAW